MAQDHFKTPPDPKKGHEMTKNPQKSEKSSRVGQDLTRECRVKQTRPTLEDFLLYCGCLVIPRSFLGSGGVLK